MEDNNISCLKKITYYNVNQTSNKRYLYLIEKFHNDFFENINNDVIQYINQKVFSKLSKQCINKLSAKNLELLSTKDLIKNFPQNFIFYLDKKIVKKLSNEFFNKNSKLFIKFIINHLFEEKDFEILKIILQRLDFSNADKQTIIELLNKLNDINKIEYITESNFNALKTYINDVDIKVLENLKNIPFNLNTSDSKDYKFDSIFNIMKDFIKEKDKPSNENEYFNFKKKPVKKDEILIKIKQFIND